LPKDFHLQKYNLLDFEVPAMVLMPSMASAPLFDWAKPMIGIIILIKKIEWDFMARIKYLIRFQKILLSVFHKNILHIN
jgi:hypothetical protein